jgi:hypothetical protein
MTITSISSSYLFLGAALIALSFYLYFRLVFLQTSPDNPSRETIFGEMKHRADWRERNSSMSHISLFWTATSAVLFIYLKFLIAPSLISTIYLILYAALIIISVVYGTVRKKVKI